MKAIRTSLLALLLTTACGGVDDPMGPGSTDSPDPIGMDDVDGIDLGSSHEPPAELPFVTEAPAAATGPGSLFLVDLAQGAQLRTLVTSTEEFARYAVLDQRIVSRTDDPIDVTIAIAAPTGTFHRTLASDAVATDPYPVSQTVLCSLDGIDYGHPECNLTAPGHRATPASGAITAARWQLILVDEAVNAAIGGCTPTGNLAMRCVIPAGSAGKAFRIRLTADGFADLWDGTPELADFSLGGTNLTGVAGALEFQCTSTLVNAGKEWCYAHWVFHRYTAIDTAGLAFDPMHVTIAATGATETFTSPALTWDAGNDDLPGDTY